MADKFDPYRVWLGIGDHDQPPHYYQLLRLRAFEDDLTTIGTTAEHQLKRLERFFDTRHDQTARRLAEEIQTALDCLLCPAAKARYDAELRRRGTVAEDVGGTNRGADHPASTDGVRTGGTGGQAAGVVVRQSERRRVPTPWWRSQWFQIPVGGIAGILIVLPLAGWLRDWRRGAAVTQAMVESTPMSPGPQVVSEPQRPPGNPAESPSADGPRTVATAGTIDEPQPADEPPAELLADELPMAAPVIEPVVAEVPVAGDPKPIAAEEVEGRNPGGDEPAVAATAVGKVTPVAPGGEPQTKPATVKPSKLSEPGDAEQQEARRHVSKLLREEFETVKTRDQGLALAKKLLDLAKQSQNEPTLRYVLLQMAQERAAEAGDLTIALDAIAQIAADYDIDPWARKAAALGATLDAARQARDPSTSGEATLAAAAALVKEALAADEYLVAREMMGALITAAQRAKLVLLARELVKREREVRSLEEGFAAYTSARDALAADPANGDANLTVGRWLGFAKGRWGEALPLLARGRDPALAQLAEQELAAPTAGPAQAELGGAWWKQCAAESGGNRTSAARRAVVWYDRALASLSGLAKIEAGQGRLEALSIVGDPEAAKVAGAVEEGDVALASKGATLIGLNITQPASLLDGAVTAYASAKCPCQWTIRLGKVYRLQEIRLHLYAPNTNSYHYAVATTSDGRKWVPLAELTSDKTRKFEQFRLDATPVMAIKVVGMACVPGNVFYAMELEAFCIPPDVAAAKP